MINHVIFKIALIGITLSGRAALAGIEVVSQRVLPGYVTGVQQSLRVGPDGDFILLGVTSNPGLETSGPPLDSNVGACFIARFSSNMHLQYYRYINGVGSCPDAVARENGDLWITAFPFFGAKTLLPIAYDLDPNNSYTPIGPKYLLRLVASTGQLISVTRFPTYWFTSINRTLNPRLVVDSTGSLWMAGHASGPFPDTPDAAEPFNDIPGLQGPGTLMRLSPNGDRILYSTHLASRSIAALAIDANDNIYVAGQFLYKLSPRGRILWSTFLPPGLALTAFVNERSGFFVGGCTNFLTGLFTTANAFQSQTDDVAINPVSGRFPPFYPDRCADGFVARFSLDGELIYSTLIGGVGDDFVSTIIADDDGVATVTGTIEGRPSRLKDLYWLPLFFNREFIARLNPLGTSVNFFTYFPLNGAGRPVPPFEGKDGELRYARREGNVDVDGNITSGVSIFAVRELTSTLPRIDNATLTGRLANGYAFEVSGAGFGDHPEVRLDGRVLPSAPAQGTGVKTAVFAIFPPSDASLQEQTIAVYRLTVRNTEDGSESAPVLVSIVYRQIENGGAIIK